MVDGPQKAIEGVKNLGQIGHEAFIEQLSNARALVGLGEVSWRVDIGLGSELFCFGRQTSYCRPERK